MSVQSIPQDSRNMLEDVLTRTRDLLWEKTDEFWHEGYLARCAAMCRLLTEFDPTDIEAYSNGAWLMSSLDREDEALAYLEQGLSFNLDRYDMYSELGQFYFRRKNYEKAVEYYEKAVKFSDCPIVIWHQLAHSYERSGDIPEAIKIWEHIMTLDPKDEDTVIERNLNRLKKLQEQSADKVISDFKD
jgi:tetratricopeptide (TPR) repeat protein